MSDENRVKDPFVVLPALLSPQSSLLSPLLSSPLHLSITLDLVINLLLAA
jgi:hypothetical protein